MKTSALTVIISLCILAMSCGLQDGSDQSINRQAPFYSHEIPFISPRISKLYDSTKIEHYDPFIVYNDDSYMIAAEIETKELFEKYTPIFEKNQYSGTGYTWDGHIKQILQKEKPTLLPHLHFDPEAGGFYVFADSEKTQRQFAEIMSKIFQDIPRLEQYIKTAHRKKIDD